MTPPSRSPTPRPAPGSDAAALRQQLSEAKQEWERTVDALSNAICVVDAAGTVRRANRAFGALAGRPLADLPGRALASLVPPAWQATIAQALDAPGAAPRTLTDGGREYAVSAHALEAGGTAHAVLVLEDRTEHRRLQDQLLQSEKLSAIGQLIAGVAHDLNNPLASVVGFADYLVEHTATVPAELTGPLTAIRQEAERAAAIVKNLLNFARRQDRRRAPVAVRTMLDATLLLMNNQFLACKTTVTLEVADGLPPVDVDANQIQQVFLNLLNNAAQAVAGTGAGAIRVSAGRWLDGVAVTIADNGPGIPDDLAERVFEPFFTTKPPGEGTGLGLSICQGILREHGGRLALVPGAGPGATFRVELPGALAAVAAPVPPADQPAHALSVLVIDDELHIRHYMEATLSAWGHAVTLAPDGAAGLAATRGQAFDLIICDIRMPELGGREFYERLLAEQPASAERVVFATGDTIRGDTLAFLEARGTAWLTKPFGLSELRQILAAARPR